MLLLFCASLLLGLLVARTHVMVPTWFVGVCAVAVALTLKDKNHLSVAVLVLLGLSIGVVRGGNYLQRLEPYSTYSGQKITIQGAVTIDAVYAQGGQLSFTINDVDF